METTCSTRTTAWHNIATCSIYRSNVQMVCVFSSKHYSLQGRIQKYGLGGREGVVSRPIPSVGSRPLFSPRLPLPSSSLPLSFPYLPLLLEVGPLNPAWGHGGAL